MQKNTFVDVQVQQQIRAGTVGADACCCATKHLNAKSADDGGTEEQTEAALNCAGKKDLEYLQERRINRFVCCESYCNASFSQPLPFPLLVITGNCIHDVQQASFIFIIFAKQVIPAMM